MLLHYIIVGLALALAAILGGWLGWQLLRQNGRILLRLDELEKRLNELEFGEGAEPKGLQVGTEAPPFELTDLSGERKSLAQFRGRPALLIFFNPDCGFCREMMPALARLPRARSFEHAMELGTPLPLIVTTGDAASNAQRFAEHEIDCPVLLQNDGEVAKAYHANGTPSGYLISSDGKIASALAAGATAVLELANESNQPPDQGLASAVANGNRRASRFANRSRARSKINRSGLKCGTHAPDFRLPRLDSGELALKEFRGRRLLLVFSDPHCGPCNALAPELQKFHREHPEMAMLMISRGEPKENRAKVKQHGLTFPIVMQQQWEISRKYAMFATPIAYLIDEAGIIAQDVAVGTDAIVELMARAETLLHDSRDALAPA
jgi:peroxiredoxin